MSKQRATTEYRVRYATDRNAALQPEFIPQPERKRAPARRDQQKRERAAHKAAVARYAGMIALVCCVAAAGLFVVTRNAAIYRNTQTIRALVKQQQELEIMVRTAEKDSSVGSELNSYFDIAQNQLNMSYPSDSEIVTVVCGAAAATETAQESAAQADVYDTVLDWFSSLEEGIRSWMQK